MSHFDFKEHKLTINMKNNIHDKSKNDIHDFRKLKKIKIDVNPELNIDKTPISTTPHQRKSSTDSKKNFIEKKDSETNISTTFDPISVNFEMSPRISQIKRFGNKSNTGIMKPVTWNRNLINYIKGWERNYKKKKNLYYSKYVNYTNYYWYISCFTLISTSITTFLNILLSIDQTETETNKGKWENYVATIFSFFAIISEGISQKYEFNIKAQQFLKHSEDYNNIVEIIRLEIEKNQEDRDNFVNFSERIMSMSNHLENNCPKI